MTAPSTSIPIRTATPSERQAVVATLVTAFSTDPIIRWIYPEPGQYLAHFPAFIERFGGSAFDHGTAYRVDGYAGAALWLPPGTEPDEEALLEQLCGSVPEPHQGAVLSLFEAVEEHHPQGPCWYLPLIGVDPHHQGRGYGSGLLQEVLARCDQEHLPAYLESSNERNLPLYERHGFEMMDRVEVAGSPPVWPMVRAAR